MDLSFFVTLAALWVLLPVVAMFFPLLRSRFQRFWREPISFDAVRPHLVTLLLPDCEALVRRGFELVSPVRVHDFELTARDGRDGYHLVHRAERVHAFVRASASPDRERPVMVVFESHLEDGARTLMLATLATRFASLGLTSPRCIQHFAPADDASMLFDAHLARRTELRFEVVDLDDATALARASEIWASCTDEPIASGAWVPVAEGGPFRLTLGSALRYSFRLRFDSARRRRMRENAAQSVKEGPAPVEEEVDGLARLDEILARPLVRSQSLALLFFGTALFIAWYGWDGWEIGLVLTAVVLFHEAGHGVAMRLAGYRDVRIYFIPFFGGATSGLNQEASIHQETLVLLAGPIPGVLLAAVLWALTATAIIPSSPLMVDIILMLVVVNYLNLLPVFPLDGGRIAHRLVAGRLPVLEILLRLVAAVTLGAGALYGLGSILGVLALALLFGTGGAWRVARLERALRQSGADTLSNDARVAAIFRSLDGVRGWTRRYALARQLALRLAAPDASWLARFGWGVVYLACLLVPLPIAIGGAMAFYGLEPGYDTTRMFEPEGEASCAAGPIAIDPTATLVMCRAEGAASGALLTTMGNLTLLDAWCVPPPWSDRAVTPEQQLARATLMEVARAELDAQMQALRERAPGTSAEDALHGPEVDASLARYVEGRRGSSDFDAVVVELWLTRDPARQSEIVARVGGTSACERFWIAGADESQVAIGPVPGSSGDVSRAAPWLCAQGCTSIAWNHWTR
jgi:Zn-dependent protease